MSDLQPVQSTRRVVGVCYQHGSTSVEYIVVTLVIVTTFFVPLPGVGESLVSTFLNALRDFQANSTFLLSMP